MPLPREPAVPPLSSTELDRIEATVFFPSEPKSSDLLFVFGTSDGDWKSVADLFIMKNIAPIVLTTGKGPPTAPAGEEPQAHTIRDALVSHGVPSDRILTEDRSTNTGENVMFGKMILKEHHLDPRSIVFACKAHHSGRCARTLAKHFPGVALSCFSYPATYEGVEVRRETWRKHAVSRARVYGEYVRIMEYTRRGYLVYL
ncbi:MAG: hypothetical protein Greene041619_495 [Candidatus Peregrinibacteria bacterium Greene0416_19]|nr:MAG: hypothetical protein Greene041619_495 [Candidatus Peregrinibacteria bacterium Greene0416_19]